MNYRGVKGSRHGVHILNVMIPKSLRFLPEIEQIALVTRSTMTCGSGGDIVSPGIWMSVRGNL
jgi:hypothetical protein